MKKRGTIRIPIPSAAPVVTRSSNSRHSNRNREREGERKREEIEREVGGGSNSSAGMDGENKGEVGGGSNSSAGMHGENKREVGGGSYSSAARRLNCTKCFDALYFCYSPFYQMQQYYRYGEFDNCFSKWHDLFDCLTLKTKKASEVEEILAAREKEKKHIWTYRTVDEASDNWFRIYRHLFYTNPPKSDS